MATTGTFVIVGASLAGAKAAEALRDNGYDGTVVLVGEEAERPYERPPLSKGYLQGQADRDTVYVHPELWYADHDVELRLGTAVRQVDRQGHEVVLDDGSRQHYDKLLLCTGSVVRRLPGADGPGVHYLRRVEDADALRTAFERAGRVVVVGAGWIGLEGAAAARHHGCEVTVLEPEPTPLHRVLGHEVGEVFAQLHRDHGVDLRLGTGLQEVRPGPVVVAADGTELPADAVLVGVGVRPATELADGCGLEVDDGVRVDPLLQTTRDPDVYAAGDCMSAEHPRYGRPLRVEHWANALNSGAAAAASMLGKGEPFDRLPYFFSDQYDLGMEFTGWFPPGGYDQVVFRGDRDGREFVAFWLDGGRRVLAGMNVNVWDVVPQVQQLIRSGRPVDPARLADPDIPLDGQ